MRISDWSSDVCSSDLERADSRQRRDQRTSHRDTEEQARGEDQIQIVEYSAHAACKRECCAGKQQHRAIAETIDQPSDDGRTESEGEANHSAHQLAEENGIGIIGKGDRKSTRLNSSH